MKKLTWLHLLLIFAVAKLLLHLYVNGSWSLHRDELLYLALGRRLAWGYASVPPSIGFWGWLCGEVTGGSVEVVRLVPTILGTGTVVLTALMAKEMLPAAEDNGKYSTFLIGLSGLLCGAYLRPCMLFQPVVFDIFYWTLLCWLFLKYLNSGKQAWLLWFGAATGLGLLNKYSVLIFLFAMLLGLLLARNRQIFTQRQFYIACGVALLICLPNIAWQTAHRFPVFRHMSDLAATQFVHVSWGGFFTDQMMFFLPALPVWLAGLYFLFFHKWAASWRIFGWMYLTVLAVLLFFSAKSYYSLGTYPVLLAAGAAFIERTTTSRLQWVRFAIPSFMLVTGLIAMPAALPVFPPQQQATVAKKLSELPGLQGILRWEDGNYYALPQDFADMLGWEEIAKATGEAWQKIPDKSLAAIYAENYGQAGAIEHFGKKYGVPPVYSFSDNYRYWLPDSLPSSFHTLIYVNDELGDDMPGFFEKIEKLWELDMPLSRQHGDQVYLCHNPTPAFFERINTAIVRARNEETID